MMKSHFFNLFEPQSIAVIGASNKPNSIGHLVLRNLIKNQFKGKIFAVNPKHQKIGTKKSYSSILDIHQAIDLALITTPAVFIPTIIEQCGQAKVKSAIIYSSGFSEVDAQGKKIELEIVALAKKYNLRLLGPNCLGVICPQHHFNASFSLQKAMPGNIAFISQSGAIFVAILDWAYEHQIGFSKLVSLGNAADVDFGELLDYLALDPNTHSILLYIEGIHRARRFMSSLRAAARIKPVIAVKSGRRPQGKKAIISHTAAIVGSDDVFDAALQRAGVVRVYSLEELFSASSILAADLNVSGKQIGIITNSGGPGVLAVDYAEELQLGVPALGDITLEKLNEFLPKNWSHNNPVDILGDATPERFKKTISVCLADESINGLLVILTPIAMSDPVEVAKAIIEVKKETKFDKPIIAAWLGETKVKSAWELFAKEGIPYFQTPEAAIEAFSYVVRYKNSQQLLLQTPEASLRHEKIDIEGARLIIETAFSQGRTVLTTLEAKSILSAFAVPTNPAYLAQDPNQALMIAETLGLPVAMKIQSPDVIHKTEVNGVILNVATGQAVRNTFQKLIENVKQYKPDAKIDGVTIEAMWQRKNGRELLLGIICDPTFGPAIVFGAGGVFVDILQERAIELPPLNTFLCDRLIQKTRVAKLIEKYRNIPAAHKEALINTIIRVSDMACELPEIIELDINPLVVDEEGVCALDARIVVNYPKTSRITYAHMAIHPYPRHLVSSWQLADGTNVTIRPIRPEDASLEREFMQRLSSETKYFRFFHVLQDLTPEMLIRFTQIDYDREMAFIGVVYEAEKEKTVGIARYITAPDGVTAEFAIVIADEWQGKGIGSKLMNELIEEARSKGLKEIVGEISTENINMITLVTHLGFSMAESPDNPGILIASKELL